LPRFLNIINMKKLMLFALLAVGLFSCSGDVSQIDVNDPTYYCWEVRATADGQSASEYFWGTGLQVRFVVETTEEALAEIGIVPNFRVYKTSKSKLDCGDVY
jgi:hypothetical protein